MTHSIRALGIALTLALTVAGQTSFAATVAQPPQTPANGVEPSPSTTGRVVETMDVASYTYLCLEHNGMKTWFAVPLTKVTVGQELAVKPGFEMVNFKSRELNRTFEKIIFSEGLVVNRDAASDEAMKRAHGGKPVEEISGNAPGSAADNIKVDKAAGPNAFTVAELYEKRDVLDKQKVVVRARVVKVSKGVMGKNWMHLRDGSGDAARHTNDLVVTTQDAPAVGEVVTASGIIHKDKDFGAGYKFALIIEEASVRH